MASSQTADPMQASHITPTACTPHPSARGGNWMTASKTLDVNNYQKAALCNQNRSKGQIYNCHRINIKSLLPSNLLEYYKADVTMVSSWYSPFWKKTTNELDM